VVRGYQIEWIREPFQIVPAITTVRSVDASQLVEEEVQDLLVRRAVVMAPPCEDQFVSCLFLVQKKDGSHRPVINLKPLNGFVQKQHFKMEGSRMVKDLLQPGDWMCSLDLKDAYHSVSIAKEHRKYLRFIWNGKIYEFTCLPFGLSSAPQTFTKLLRPVMAYMRAQGTRLIVYLDDILLMHQSKESLGQQVNRTAQLLESLGFTVNQEKSNLTPTQKIQFLGFLVDSMSMKFFLPEEKAQGISHMCQNLLQQHRVTIRQLSQLLGRMTAAAPAVLSAPLRYRQLQQLRIRAFRRFESFDTLVTLDQGAIQDLQWWKDHLAMGNGRNINQPTPDLVIESDASLMGWGAVCRGVRTGGLWSAQEQRQHINILELKAGMFAVQAFVKDKLNVHVHLKMDNTSALAYVCWMGGTRSPNLMRVACEIWDWCLQRGVTLSGSHLPGRNNQIADWESREIQTSAEWKLKVELFHRICAYLGPCRTDLFASRLNKQLDRYISWRPDPGAILTDAFQTNWKELEGYAFPPFALIGRCLQKVRVEQSTIVLVAPLWRNQAWFPMLLDLAVELPLLIPHCNDLLLDPKGQPHPLVCSNRLRLTAWKLSGSRTLQLEFQKKLQPCSLQGGAQALTPPTSLDGNGGVAGVREGKLIPFCVGFSPSLISSHHYSRKV